MAIREISILLVEDNPGDARLIREMLRSTRRERLRCRTAAGKSEKFLPLHVAAKNSGQTIVTAQDGGLEGAPLGATPLGATPLGANNGRELIAYLLGSIRHKGAHRISLISLEPAGAHR